LRIDSELSSSTSECISALSSGIAPSC
jgi:hypothetical protein